jgi:DNA-binding NtrC family response regulator
MPADVAEPNESLTVLVVDDEAVARTMLGRLLRSQGCNVRLAANGRAALHALSESSFDVVLTDLVMDDVDGMRVLLEAKRRDQEVEVIVMTGHASVETAIEAMRKGAFHYLQKPLRPDDVRNLVRQAGQKKALSDRVRALEAGAQHDALSRIVGTSRAIRAVRGLIDQVRSSDSNVMITGESGTGKELVARAIHATSRRGGRGFVAFNCASLSDDLLANELFGHERDAYTGASSARAGLLESGQGGTVFFDEVGDMSLAMQAKLLRVVQEREVLRVGATKPIPVDIRIISATNKDLERLITLRSFREDLYFRLNVIPVRMPTLAERSEDIPLLAMHFLRRAQHTAGKRVDGFSEEALELLVRYRYPGNVRELENIVERAASLATHPTIEAGNLPADLTTMDLRTFRYESEQIKTLEEMEREYIRWVLDRVGHNKTKAAQLLGIDRVSLYRKLKRCEIIE